MINIRKAILRRLTPHNYLWWYVAPYALKMAIYRRLFVWVDMLGVDIRDLPEDVNSVEWEREVIKRYLELA